MPTRHSFFSVFVSYSSTDAEFARVLALDLRNHGLSVWFDQWEMQPGDSLRLKIGEAITRSSYVAVVLSPDSVRSRWVRVELNAAFARELQRRSVIIVPVLYRKCRIPPFLRDKVYADFTEDYAAGLRQLLKRFGAKEISVDPTFVFEELRDKDVAAQVKRILNRLAEQIGTNVSLVTANAERIASDYGPHSEYYRLLSKSDNASLHPAFREWQAYRLVEQRGASLEYECAWLTSEVCMPIIVHECLLGVCFSGQILGRDIDPSVADRMRRQEEEDNLEEGALLKAIRKLKVMDRKQKDAVFKTLAGARDDLGKALRPYLSKSAPQRKTAADLASQKMPDTADHSKKRRRVSSKRPSKRRKRPRRGSRDA